MGLREGGTGWEATDQSTGGDKKIASPSPRKAQLGVGGWV